MNTINPTVANLPKSGIRKFFDLVLQAGPEVVSLGVGEPDFATPWHIREAMCFAIEKGFTSYTENAGLMELRQEVSKYSPIPYDPKTEILITNGVSEGMDIAFRATVCKGDIILVPDPGYVMYEPLIKLAGGIPIPYNPLKISELTIPQKTKGIVLNFPGNPMGNIFSLQELQTIAQKVEEADILIYSDEIYAALSFEQKHISIIEIPKAEKIKGRTLYFNGLSKSHAMTGMRVGWVCGPEKIISQMTKIHQYSALCTNSPAQIGAVEALRNGEKEMLKMTNTFNKRRQYCISRLDTMGVEYITPKGAFYIFMQIPKKFTGTDVEFCEQLLNTQKLAIVPGSAFGKTGEGNVRMTYAASIKELSQAFDRLETFITTL